MVRRQAERAEERQAADADAREMSIVEEEMFSEQLNMLSDSSDENDTFEEEGFEDIEDAEEEVIEPSDNQTSV